MAEYFRIESISQVHAMLGLEKPRHPLITLLDASQTRPGESLQEIRGKVVNELYFIGLKNGTECRLIYGRQSYDFQEGTIICLAPGQVVSPTQEKPSSSGDPDIGWTLMFHPSLIRGTRLAARMREYTFFSYQANEALHVSEQERTELGSLLELIRKEYTRNIDTYSESIILSNLELLFNYLQRYYGRQFLTRAGETRDVMARFESYLDQYFSADRSRLEKLPTVRHCAEHMGYSPNYFSDLLKKETGKTAQEHIHARLIDKAKDLLLATEKPVNRIAFDLGFEYPQHFSKLFKSRTGITPAAFRRGNEA